MIVEDAPFQHAPSRLSLAIGGFAVASSMMFLLEQLGVPPSVISWALFLILAIIAVAFSVMGRTLESSTFFSANRLAPAVVIAVADSASWIGGIMLVSLAFSERDTTVYLAPAIALAWFLSSQFIAPYYRRSTPLSVPDYFAHRFRSSLIRLLSFVILLMVAAALLNANLRLGADLISSLLGLATQTSATMLMVSMVICMVIGGVKGSLWLGLALTTAAITLLLTPAIYLAVVDGPSPVSSLIAPPSALQDPQRLDEATALTKKMWIDAGRVGIMIAGGAVLAVCFGKSNSARTVSTVRDSGTWSLLIGAVLMALVLTTLPLLIRPDTADSLPAILTILPELGLVALCFIGGSCALLAAANSMAHDVFRRIIARKTSKGRRMFLARFLMIVFAYGMLYYGDRIELLPFDLVLWALGLAASTLFVPFVASIWWSRCTKWGVNTAILAGMVTYLSPAAITYINARNLLEGLQPEQMALLVKLSSQPIELAAMAGFFVSLITITLVSVVTPAPSEDRRRFLSELRKPLGERLIVDRI